MRKTFWTILLFIIASTGFSQLDTEHYLAPLTSAVHPFIGNAGHQIIYLSTPSPTPVNYTIYDGANNIINSGTVSNGAPIAYGAAGEMNGANTDLMIGKNQLNKPLIGRGIRVVSDAPVYCNVRIRSSNNAQAASITSKGKNALGKTFRIGHMPTPQKASLWGLNSLGSKLATFGIYATEDNTTVTINLTKVKPVLHGPGAPNTNAPFTVNLNKGETYVLALKNADSPNRNAGAGFNGGLITSDKSIAVSSGSMGGYMTNNYQADYGADQIVPYDKVGSKYVVVRGASAVNGLEQVMVIAHKNGTEVKINGVVVKTLNAGQYYLANGSKYINGAMFIETSVPAYAYQFMMGSNKSDNKTPGMNFLPPITCETSNYVDEIPFINKAGNLNLQGGSVNIVTTKTGSDIEFFKDGVKSNNLLGLAKNVPNSDYVYYKVSNLKGHIAVYSKTLALVSFSGYNGAAGFGGFYSGWKEGVVEDSVTCLPGHIFETSGRYDSYRWFKDGVEISGETNDSLFATETGYYEYEYEIGGCRDTSDSIYAVALNEFELEGDTTFCAGDSVEWNIIGHGFDSISWNNGVVIKKQNVFIDSVGTTPVRIYSDIAQECYVDTTVLSVEMPIPIVVLRDTLVCLGESVTLDAENDLNTVEWNTGALTQEIDIDASGDYKVVVTTSEGCVDSAQMTFLTQSCKTDVMVTKTDGRDDYTPGTTSEYTIIVKNLGPNDFKDGTVEDPLPTGIVSGDVSWDAIAYDGAVTASVGSQTGALSDVVSIPVGDSIVYSVNVAIPVDYTGDFVNVVTVSVDIDTNAINDVATDINENGLCTGATVSSFAEQFNTGVKINPGENDPNWMIQWINDPAYHVYSANSYATPSSNALIPAVGMNKAAPVWGDASYPDYLWVCYPWIGADNGDGKHSDVDGDGISQEYSGGAAISGTGDAVLLKFSKTFEMTAAQLEASELSFSIAADNEIMDIIVNGVSQGPKVLGSYQLIPHKITQDLQLGTNTIEIIVNSGPSHAGLMIANATIKAVDSVSLITTDPPLACAPNRVDLTNSLWTEGSINATNLLYYEDAAASILFGNPTVADSGTYTVVAINDVGCSDTAEIYIGQHPLPDVALRADTSFCMGGEITIDGGLFDTWTWNVGLETVQTITIDSTYEYKLTVANQFGCLDSDSVLVTVHPLPEVVLRNDTAVCPRDVITLDAKNPGITYLWSTTETSNTIEVTDSALYYVIITDGNGCKDKDTFNLAHHPEPDFTLRNDTIVCSPEVVEVDAGVWDSYTWSNGSTNQEITLTKNDTVWVDVANGSGCLGRDSIGIQVIALPVVDLGDTLEVCIGSSDSIDAGNPGLNFIWNTGENTQGIEVDTEGDYGLKVTDQYGCLGSDSTYLTVHALPIVNLGNDTIICFPESITIDAGSWDFYTWNTGHVSRTISPDTTGVYVVTILDSNNCEKSADKALKVNQLPVINLGEDTTLCVNETVDLDAGNPGWIYEWNTGETDRVVFDKDSGGYKVRVYDVIGCEGDDSIYIGIERIPDPYPEKAFEICEGEVQVLAPESGYEIFQINWPYAGAQSSSIDVTEAGDYVSYVNGFFCVDSFILNLEVIDTPDVYILNLKGRDKVCFDYENIELELKVDGLQPRFSYLWSTGATETNIVTSEPGIYSVITSNELCESYTQYVLEEYCPGNLFIPNAFTPSDDGVNDRFQTKGYNLIDFEVWIYNRWGGLLFTTTDLNNWWDGTYQGNPCQIDVYVWKARYSILSENGDTDKFQKVGRVSLIR